MELLKFRIDYEFYVVLNCGIKLFLLVFVSFKCDHITWQKYQINVNLFCLLIDIELVSLSLDPLMISQFWNLSCVFLSKKLITAVLPSLVTYFIEIQEDG